MCSVSYAQPILTATGTNPVIGDSYTFNNGAYVSPGNSGVSQTWNFSSMSGTSAGLTNVVAPSITPNASSFSNANIAALNNTAGTCNYYKKTSSAIQSYGVTGSSTVIPYSNPEDFLHFPFAYTNTFTDPWEGQFSSGGYTFYRTGTTIVTADGWGTLITPAGTYTDVMRVHFVENYQDSAFLGTPYITTYVNDQYMWYKESVHVQLASVFILTPSTGSAYTGGTYTSTIVTGISNPEGFIGSSNIFPNPAMGKITVDFTLSENKSLEIQLYNEFGQQAAVNQSAEGVLGLNTITLNVATLPQGIYFAHILVEGNIAASKRFVVVK